MKRFWFRQAFRLYAVALAVWGAWTLAWMTLDLSTAPSYLAAGWYVTGAFGAILAVGFYANRTTALSSETAAQRARKARFQATPLNEPLLGLYAVALVGWAALTGGWWLSGFAILDATVVGAGWYAIAIVGVAVVVGLSAAVREDTIPLGSPAARND